MAIRKSSRSRAHRARSAERTLVLPSRRRGRKTGSPSARIPITKIEDLPRLSVLTWRLRTIYGVAVAAQHALRHQAAEQDAEIADCLRAGVSEPIADQIRVLQEITGIART